MYVTYCTDRSVLIVLVPIPGSISSIYSPQIGRRQNQLPSTQLLKHYRELVIKYYLNLQACQSVRGLLAGKEKKKPEISTLKVYLFILSTAEIQLNICRKCKSLPFYLLPTYFMTFTVSTSPLADKIKFLFPGPCSFRPLLIKSLLTTMP